MVRAGSCAWKGVDGVDRRAYVGCAGALYRYAASDARAFLKTRLHPGPSWPAHLVGADRRASPIRCLQPKPRYATSSCFPTPAVRPPTPSFFAGFPISWVLDKISHRAVYHGSMLASGSSFCTPSASASCSSCCCTGGEAHIDEKSAAACPPCSHVMVHVAPQPVASGDGEDVMAGGGGKQAGGRAGSSAGGEDAVSQVREWEPLTYCPPFSARSAVRPQDHQRLSITS